MLTLTENATTFIRALAAGADGSGDRGLRIAADRDRTGRFAIAIASAPAEDDLVLEESGARVFVDRAGAGVLAGKRLDARLEHDSVLFFLQDA